jgi:hypothetical protein
MDSSLCRIVKADRRRYLCAKKAFLWGLHTGWKPMLHWFSGLWSDL